MEFYEGEKNAEVPWKQSELLMGASFLKCYNYSTEVQMIQAISMISSYCLKCQWHYRKLKMF